MKESDDHVAQLHGVSELCPAGADLWLPRQAGLAFLGHYHPQLGSRLVLVTASGHLSSYPLGVQGSMTNEHLVKMLHLIQQF